MDVLILAFWLETSLKTAFLLLGDVLLSSWAVLSSDLLESLLDMDAKYELIRKIILVNNNLFRVF